MGLNQSGQGWQHTTKKPRVRRVFLVLLGLVIAGAAGFVVFIGALPRAVEASKDFLRAHHMLPKRLETDDEAARSRAARTHAIASVALAPLPATIPLVERPGKDAYGYPRSYVDRAALRSLLAHGKYVELSLYFEQFQKAFEADFHSEYFINDATDAFETAELDLGAKLDAWQQATPDSFAPYLAQGAHGLALAHAARGSEFVTDTNRKNFDAMHAAFVPASATLEHALTRNPRLISALRDEIRIAFIDGRRKDFEAFSDRAATVCPACFQFRVSIQVGLEPRWGGSYDAMASEVSAANVRLNPRFTLLPGYAAIDRADVALHANQFDEALSEAEKACALGDNADFLEEKSRALSNLNRAPEATRALTAALDLRPSRSDLMFERATSETQIVPADWHAAFTDVSQGLRIDPTSNEARRSMPYIARGLYDAGWAAHQRHDETEAIRLLDEGLDLVPSREIEMRRVAVLTANFHGTDAEIDALAKAADAAPHDEYLHARLDYALSERKDWTRIVDMWNAYIAQNPSDGRAYLELAGTYQHLGNSAADHACLERACELGVSAACAFSRH